MAAGWQGRSGQAVACPKTAACTSANWWGYLSTHDAAREEDMIISPQDPYRAEASSAAQGERIDRILTLIFELLEFSYWFSAAGSQIKLAREGLSPHVCCLPSPAPHTHTHACVGLYRLSSFLTSPKQHKVTFYTVPDNVSHLQVIYIIWGYK